MTFSSPKGRTEILLVVVFTFLSAYTSAQTFQYTWSEPGRLAVLPDSLSNEDAVMVYYLQRLEYGYRASFCSEVRRIKILSRLTRDYYSNLSVSVYTGVETIRILDARTIKPDGKVVTLSQSGIMKNEKDFNGDGETDFITYSVPVPAVEIGDEIEIILMKRIKHYPNFRFTRFAYGVPGTGPGGNSVSSYAESSLFNVFLHSELYCMRSEFQLLCSPEFRISYNCYNGLPKPMIEKDSSRLLLKCAMDNLPPLRDKSLSCMPCEVPYISFYVAPLISFLNFNPNPRSWKDLYFASVNEFNPDDASYWNKLNYFFNYYEKQIKPFADSGSLYQFRKYYNYVKDNVDVKPVHPMEEDYNIGYFLSGSYMDKRNLMKSYRKMLEYLNLPYYYCFVRPKNKGPLDMNFFREGEVSDVFLAFRDEKNNFHIIQPHKYYGNTFELDEVSPEYRGTTAVLVRVADSLQVKMLAIPEHPYSDNNSTVTGKLAITAGDSLLRIKAKVTLSGDFSTATRNTWRMIDSIQHRPPGKQQLEDAMMKDAGVDSIHLDSYSGSYPYPFRFSFASQVKNRARMIENGVYNLPVEDIIRHFEMTAPSSNRKLGLYFPFAYTMTYKMMLNFDKPAEILNADKFSFHEDNETVSFSSSLSRLNENAFLLTVNYTLKTAVVKASALPNLATVKKDFDLFYNLSLLYKMQNE